MANNQLALDTFTRHNVRFGTVIELNPQHLIGGEFFGNYSDFNFKQDNRISLTNQENTLESGQTIFAGYRDLVANNLTINYQWKLDTSGAQLQVFGDYTGQRALWFNTARSTYEQGQYTDNEERNNTDNRTQIFSVQTDWLQPISSAIKLEAGLKWSRIDRKNALVSEFFEQESWIENDRSTAFNYLEEISGIYGTISNQLDERHFLKLGLRIEHTQLEKQDLLDASLIEQNYLNWFPSAFISRKLSDKNSLTLSYTKRIRRPPFAFLNDNIRKYNDFRYELGNPDLQPEYRHRYELGLQLNKDHFALFYSQTNDAINGIYYLEGEIAYYQKFNEGSQKQWGIEYNRTGRLTPWWDIQARGQLFRRRFTDANGQDIFHQTTLKVRVINTFKLNQTTSVEVFANYYSPQADAYFIRE
ncbi:MAG: outer membrane beta-barrel family protein, partial [Bacteroidota bacterium]